MLNVFMTPSALAIFDFSKDNLVLAAQTVVLGMVMIFAVLGLLWGVLSIFKLVFVGASPKEPKQNKSAKVEAEIAKTEEAVAETPVAQDNDDAQLVAVITAAVAAYMADEGVEAPDGSFRVVSFKRVQSGRAWNSK